MRRSIVITGASRGIGRAIAERLLLDGHRLSLGLRQPDQLKDTVLDHPDVLRLPYDAADAGAGDALVSRTEDQWGGFDSLIHCAGCLHRTPLLFDTTDEAALDELWRVNLMGPWRLTRAAWPMLKRSGHGRIQVLVSMSGKRVKGRMAGYPVSKFGLMALCQAMRNEGWQDGIRVTAICPSWVATDMALGVSALPAEAMTQPDDLAALSSSLLQLGDASVPFELALNCALEV